LCGAVEAALRVTQLEASGNVSEPAKLEIQQLVTKYEPIWQRIRFVALDVVNFPSASAANRLVRHTEHSTLLVATNSTQIQELLDILRDQQRVGNWFIVPKRKYLFGKFHKHMGEILRRVTSKGGSGVLLKKPLKAYNAPNSAFIEKVRYLVTVSSLLVSLRSAKPKPFVRGEVEVIGQFRETMGLLCKQFVVTVAS